MYTQEAGRQIPTFLTGLVHKLCYMEASLLPVFTNSSFRQKMNRWSAPKAQYNISKHHFEL